MDFLLTNGYAERTKLVGRVHYDVRVEPRDKEEEGNMVMRQMANMEKGKTGLTIISRNKASTITNLGSAASVNWSSNFIVSFLVRPCSCIFL